MAELLSPSWTWEGTDSLPDVQGSIKDKKITPIIPSTQSNSNSWTWEGTDSLPDVGENSSGSGVDTSDYGIDTHATLSKNDLKNGEYAEKIRRYMVHMKGVEYKDPREIDNNELVEDFYNHMRWFNSNTFSTAMEAKRVYNSDDSQKRVIAEAYDLYDAAGNLFGSGSEGLGDIFDGLKDYFLASASDPSNYLGLLTGGIAKGMTTAGSVAGKELIKRSIAQASLNVSKGAGKKSLAAAEKRAWKQANKLLKENGINKNAKDGGRTLRTRLANEAAERESIIFKEELANKLNIASKAKLDKKFGRRALAATVGMDSAIGMYHDYTIQQIYSDVDPNYEYSKGQTAIAGAFGLVAGGAHLGVKVLRNSKVGKSGLQDYKTKSDIAFKRTKSLELLKMAVDTPTAKKIGQGVLEHVVEWRKSVRASAKKGWFTNLEGEKEVDFLKTMMLGANGDGQGGIVGVLLKQKVPVKLKNGKLKLDAKGKVVKEPLKLSMHTTVTDLLTQISKAVDPKVLANINRELQGTGLALSDFGDNLPTGSLSLGNLARGIVGKSAANLQVMSQSKKMLEPLITYSEHINKRIASLDGLEAVYTRQGTTKSNLTGGKWAAYGHNFWRRMLVSAPSTTAVNIAGYGQFAIARTASDILTSGALFGKGVLQAAAGEDAAAKETWRVARILKDIQGQKFRNYLDSHTTREAYLAILNQNPDLERILKATTSMGIETKAKKFNVDPDNPVYKIAEAIANGSHAITGVRAQDTFTKSQMFITELDKNLRIRKKKTLSQVINSTNPDDIRLIDHDMISETLDTTLKSVFSDDYTKGKGGDVAQLVPGVDSLISKTATIVEGISNTPVVGTFLPFGKFFNNLIGFTWNWTAGGAVDAMAAVAARQKPARIKAFNNMTVQQQSADMIKPIEAAARSAIGLTALGWMAHEDKDSYEKGLPWYHVDVGGGTEIDIKNVFPFSLWKVLARIMNHAYLGTDGIDALQDPKDLNPKSTVRPFPAIGKIPPELLVDLGAQIAIGQVAKDAQFSNDLLNMFAYLWGQNDDRRTHKNLDGLYQATGNILAGTTRPLDMFNDMAGFVFNSEAAKDPRQTHGLSRFSIHATKYVDNIVEMFTDNIDAITGEQLIVATRTDVTRDPSALASMLGIKIVQGQSPTERVYALAEMPTYKGNKRSGAPEYDRLFNKVLGPKLDKFFGDISRIREYKNLNIADRQRQLKRQLTKFKAEVTSELAMMSPSVDMEGSIAVMRYQILNANKNVKYTAKAELENEALKMGKPITHNFILNDMNMNELMRYQNKIKAIKEEEPYLYLKGLE